MSKVVVFIFFFAFQLVKLLSQDTQTDIHHITHSLLGISLLMSFSTDNVIAIGNEAIKMAIKVGILLPSSGIWPFVMPIFPRTQRQALRDSICSRSKVCPTTRSPDRLLWQMLGPIYWTTGKVRVRELTIFYPVRLSEGVWSKQERGADTLYWPLASPPVKFPVLFHSDAPFWLILTEWFCFVLPIIY